MSKKLVYDFGNNDIPDSYNEKFRKVWTNMLERSYSEIYHKRCSTYKDVYVNDEWINLSDFKSWYINNYIDGYSLDKDLLVPNNKEYSSKTCLFIPKYINSMIVNMKGKGYSKRPYNKWQTQIGIYGKTTHIGMYDTEIDAHNAYIFARAKYFINEADNWIDENPKILLGLFRQAKSILGDDWDAFVRNNPYHYFPNEKDMIW